MWRIAYEETNLVSRRRGTLPVIQSAPHAGTEAHAGAPTPTGAKPVCPRF